MHGKLCAARSEDCSLPFGFGFGLRHGNWKRFEDTFADEDNHDVCFQMSATVGCTADCIYIMNPYKTSYNKLLIRFPEMNKCLIGLYIASHFMYFHVEMVIL